MLPVLLDDGQRLTDHQPNLRQDGVRPAELAAVQIRGQAEVVTSSIGSRSSSQPFQFSARHTQGLSLGRHVVSGDCRTCGKQQDGPTVGFTKSVHDQPLGNSASKAEPTQLTLPLHGPRTDACVQFREPRVHRHGTHGSRNHLAVFQRQAEPAATNSPLYRGPEQASHSTLRNHDAPAQSTRLQHRLEPFLAVARTNRSREQVKSRATAVSNGTPGRPVSSARQQLGCRCGAVPFHGTFAEPLTRHGCRSSNLDTPERHPSTAWYVHSRPSTAHGLVLRLDQARTQ